MAYAPVEGQPVVERAYPVAGAARAPAAAAGSAESTDMNMSALRLVAFILAIGPSQAADPKSMTSFAEHASERALTFQQGDRRGFIAARDSFTPEAWTAFLKDMRGWLDENGTPTFGSSFVSAGTARIVAEENGVVHVRVPGTLTQTQNQSRTTYRRFAVDVWAAGDPLKIQKLTQTTCVGASTACQ
jgi:hypothetical protein